MQRKPFPSAALQTGERARTQGWKGQRKSSLGGDALRRGSSPRREARGREGARGAADASPADRPYPPSAAAARERAEPWSSRSGATSSGRSAGRRGRRREMLPGGFMAHSAPRRRRGRAAGGQRGAGKAAGAEQAAPLRGTRPSASSHRRDRSPLPQREGGRERRARTFSFTPPRTAQPRGRRRRDRAVAVRRAATAPARAAGGRSQPLRHGARTPPGTRRASRYAQPLTPPPMAAALRMAR